MATKKKRPLKDQVLAGPGQVAEPDPLLTVPTEGATMQQQLTQAVAAGTVPAPAPEPPAAPVAPEPPPEAAPAPLTAPKGAAGAPMQRRMQKPPMAEPVAPASPEVAPSADPVGGPAPPGAPQLPVEAEPPPAGQTEWTQEELEQAATGRAATGRAAPTRDASVREYYDDPEGPEGTNIIDRAMAKAEALDHPPTWKKVLKMIAMIAGGVMGGPAVPMAIASMGQGKKSQAHTQLKDLYDAANQATDELLDKQRISRMDEDRTNREMARSYQDQWTQMTYRAGQLGVNMPDSPRFHEYDFDAIHAQVSFAEDVLSGEVEAKLAVQQAFKGMPNLIEMGPDPTTVGPALLAYMQTLGSKITPEQFERHFTPIAAMLQSSAIHIRQKDEIELIREQGLIDRETAKTALGIAQLEQTRTASMLGDRRGTMNAVGSLSYAATNANKALAKASRDLANYMRSTDPLMKGTIEYEGIRDQKRVTELEAVLRSAQNVAASTNSLLAQGRAVAAQAGIDVDTLLMEAPDAYQKFTTIAYDDTFIAWMKEKGYLQQDMGAQLPPDMLALARDQLMPEFEQDWDTVPRWQRMYTDLFEASYYPARLDADRRQTRRDYYNRRAEE